MSIVFIYSHTERNRVDSLAKRLEDLGYDVTLGPLGFEVMTQEWLETAQRDIEGADCVLLLLTKASAQDVSVVQRCAIASQFKKRLFPIMLEEDVGSLSMLHPFIRSLQSLLWRPDRDDLERVLRALNAALPKTALSPKRCFISYSRADSGFAAKVTADLRERGLTCWRDVDDISAGANWDKEIEKALTECSHILLVWSQQSVDSTNVADEISFARARKKLIIPLLLDDAPLPLRVHRAQAIDFTSEYSRGLDDLLLNLGVQS
jgi:hypothetical protein